MWLSDRIIGGFSAYSKVSYQVCTRLARMGHSVAHIPMGRANKMGKQSYHDVLIYPSGNHVFAEDVAVPHYCDWKSDMLIAFKEVWAFNNIFKYAVNFVPYVPIDHSPVSPSVTSRLHTAFKVLVPSKFGQNELRNAGIKNAVHMPHGVDTSLYRPIEDQAACRERFSFDPDEFVVLYIGWNRPRKMLSHMLRGYKLFTERNPDVKTHFMLWTPVSPPRVPQETPLGVSQTSINILPEIVNLKLYAGQGSCRWPDWDEVLQLGGLPEYDPVGGWDMVRLINSADVVLGCTGGEGYWLVGDEAQACGVPVIVTDYAAAPERVGAGLTVPAKDYVIINTPGTRYAIPDIDKMADAITKIMNSDKEKLSRRARSFAMRSDWERVMNRHWKPFLEDCSTELHPLITKTGVKAWA